MVVTFSLDFICSMTTIFLYNAWPSIHSLNCAYESFILQGAITDDILADF